MNKMGYGFVVVVFLGIQGIFGKQLPNYLEPCHFEDPNIERCLIKNVEILRPKFTKGVPELGIPSLNPLRVEEATLNHGAFNAKFTDIRIYNADKFDLQQMKIDLKKQTLDVNIKFPSLRILSVFHFKGNILSIPLDGTGPADGNYTNVQANFKVSGKLNNRNGKSFLDLKSYDLELDIGKPHFNFENIFKDNPELNQRTNELINENIEDILIELKPVVKNVIGDVVVALFTRIFAKFSFEELFPK